MNDFNKLAILPDLACMIGLHPSIFLHEVHLRLLESELVQEDRIWVCSTYEAWHKKFPFWRPETIRKIAAEARDMGILLVGKFNKSKFDRTNWYSIDYDALVRIASESGNPAFIKLALTMQKDAGCHTDKYTETIPDYSIPLYFHDQSSQSAAHSTPAYFQEPAEKAPAYTPSAYYNDPAALSADPDTPPYYHEAGLQPPEPEPAVQKEGPASPFVLRPPEPPIRMDLPSFPENGSAAENTLSAGANSEAEPASELGDDRLMRLYMEHYEATFSRPHPKLKFEQMKRACEILNAFADRNNLRRTQDFLELIDSFFGSNLDTDYNINHFASPGILKTYFKYTFGRYPDMSIFY